MVKQLVWFKCKHLMTVMLDKIVDDIKPNMRMTYSNITLFFLLPRRREKLRNELIIAYLIIAYKLQDTNRN